MARRQQGELWSCLLFGFVRAGSGSGSSTGPTAEKLHADKRRSAFVAQVKEASSSSRLQHPLLLSLQPQIWKELLHE